MTKSKKLESGILASVHKTAVGLHDAGLVDKATMREFDALGLTPVEPLTAGEIRALREREQVSQPVFAQYLNVFVLVVQMFQKIPALKALAPTQSEPPFGIAQGLVLLGFLWAGFAAVKRTRAMA